MVRLRHDHRRHLAKVRRHRLHVLVTKNAQNHDQPLVIKILRQRFQDPLQRFLIVRRVNDNQRVTGNGLQSTGPDDGGQPSMDCVRRDYEALLAQRVNGRQRGDRIFDLVDAQQRKQVQRAVVRLRVVRSGVGSVSRRRVSPGGRWSRPRSWCAPVRLPERSVARRDI